MASRLVETLFPLPDHRRTPLSLFRWWESRRWLYNKVVGTTGLITLTGVLLVHPYRAEMLEPGLVVAVLAYGVAANLCYSLGWIADVWAHLIWGRKAPDLGPILFREGLVLSVGVTLIPLVITVLLTLASMVFGAP